MAYTLLTETTRDALYKSFGWRISTLVGCWRIKFSVLDHWGHRDRRGYREVFMVFILFFPRMKKMFRISNQVIRILTFQELIEVIFFYVRLLICALFCIYLNSMFLKLGLQSWEDIDKLNSFPKLEEVRLLGIPLLQPYTTEERRKLVIARSVVLITLLSSLGALFHQKDNALLGGGVPCKFICFLYLQTLGEKELNMVRKIGNVIGLPTPLKHSLTNLFYFYTF